MSERQLIHRLVASEEYQALQRLEPEFNIFCLLDDALREPAWSRILSGILDSTLPHRLEDTGFREWMALVDQEARKRGQPIPPFFGELPQKSTIRTSVEYCTPTGRRIDILVRVLDSKHRVLAVVGIENKLDSPEQPTQISDYQAALSEVFPHAHRLVVYLTPDGREAQTADSLSKCPYVPASYRTMVGMCQALRHGAESQVNVLLDSLSREIEAAVFGEDSMKNQAKKHVLKLWSDTAHRKAIRLIMECIPTARNTWETGLLKRIETRASGLGMRLVDDSIAYYPARSDSPHEIQIHCGGKVAEKTSQAGFSLCYMLRCEEQKPDIGSEFCLRLLAWCDSARARQRLKGMNLERVLPPGGTLKNWSSWVGIWTGRSYVLQDMGAADLKGLANLFVDGARRTYPTLVDEVARLR